MKDSRINGLVTVKINSTTHDGRGIALINGKVTFVENALLHEEVICKITKYNSNYNEAKTIKIISSNPDRITPFCKHYNICGGCNLQHTTHANQINLKQKILLEQLQRLSSITPKNILEPIISSPWFYRRRARLGVKAFKKNHNLIIGFREKATNQLTDLSQCPILSNKISNNLTALKELINNLSVYESIPQIEVAIGDNNVALIIRHMKTLPYSDIEKLCAFGKKYSYHLYLQPNKPEKIYKIWPTDNIYNLSYFLEIDNHKKLEMQFHPGDFIQVNGDVNQQLVKLALQLLDPKSNDIILDLFCGIGNFTLPLAKYSNLVVGVEGAKELIIQANENAKINHINNVEFYVDNLMKTSLDAKWMLKQFDKILLDPPRTGAKEFLTSTSNLSAKKICYVSCNPGTLARDTKELVHKHGYTLTNLGLIDMFPQTNHIEAIALFEK